MEPNPNTVHPIRGCDKEINHLIPVLTNSDLTEVKEMIRKQLG